MFEWVSSSPLIVTNLWKAVIQRCSGKKVFLKIPQNSQETRPQTSNFIKKETLTQVFSCEFCQISKNTFFTEHLRATSSMLLEGRRLKQIEISIISKLTKKIIKKEKCSYFFYFLLIVLTLFLFGLHFL